MIHITRTARWPLPLACRAFWREHILRGAHITLIRDDAVERTGLRRDRRYRSRLMAIPSLIEQLENRCLLSHVSSSGPGGDITAGRSAAALRPVELSKIKAGHKKHATVVSPVIAGYTPDQIRA